MAETLCGLKKKGGGGGGLKEISLWTNSAPTSSFAAQTVTLSQSIENFDYIKIKYKYGTSVNTTLSSIYSVEDFKQSIEGGSHNICLMGILTPSTAYARILYYVSATSVKISAYYGVGTAFSGGIDSAIPLEIIGLK